MKIAITGPEGNIGSRLIKLGCEPLSCDVTDRKQVASELLRVMPDVVLHLAAQTNVDWCQEHYEEAIVANVYGTSVLCEEAERILGEGKVALISSDMVFDGRGEGCYKEDAEPNPINNYGFTKFGAEAVAQLYGDKIVRISRCFDSKSKDIVEYLYALKTRDRILVPDHIYRSYCHLDLMAESLLVYAAHFKHHPDILHIAGEQCVSYYAFMLKVADTLGYSFVNPRGEIPGYTPRPYKTGLNTDSAQSLGIPIYSIDMSVQRLKHEKP